MSPRLEAFFAKENNITAIPEMNLKAIHSHPRIQKICMDI